MTQAFVDLGPFGEMEWPERRARLRDLRIICLQRLGPLHRATLALTAAEAGDAQALDVARETLDGLPTLTSRGILSVYGLLQKPARMPPPPKGKRRTF